MPARPCVVGRWQVGDLPANHRASGCALEAGRKSIGVQGELQESMGPGSEGRAWQVGRIPENHRASGCALEARRMAIALSGELQERGMQGLHGCVWQVGDLPANHRASGYALECCLEGFGSLDGHKSMPSRERMCSAGP